MNPARIKTSLRSLIPLGQPVFLWGAPGVGKSQVVAQVAEELGRELIDIRAVLLDPVDLRGLPSVDGQVARWNPPAFLPREGTGVLFLDELNAAPPLVQAACYQLVLDRRVGEYELPEGWAVVAAGNRETDRAVTHRMPSALANRFVHLDFSVDVNDWLAWAEQAGLGREVLDFIRFRPNLLHAFDPRQNEKAFPSPRSWEFAARVLAVKPDPEVELGLLKGTVGPGAAV
ncbi:MAG TPA: MoxR family ATPase, partial [Pseudodesulfovibrio sp.]|nr:MoxR family ATPase [Pseudodesulfovibrio sp.]